MTDMISQDMKAPYAPVVLVVDDDETIRRIMLKNLKGEGYEILEVPDGSAALETLRGRDADLVLLDLAMPRMGGVEVLERIRREGFTAEVMVVSGESDLQTAVRCMKLGAVDYILKPWNPDALRNRVREVLKGSLLKKENVHLRTPSGPGTPSLVGGSPAMKTLRDLIGRVAQSEEPVLVCGESGTGKELVARSIHTSGPRAAEPFLPVDCTTLNPSVIESELFGHVKGAFTGAESGRKGLLRAAGGGTVFLDEIGELPLELQPKLLRALQEQEFRPVGSSVVERFNARIIAATNRDLQVHVRDGKFREDLYWRLNVLAIQVPPLRDRQEDIVELAQHFLARYDRTAAGPRSLDEGAREALAGYSWPGNIRELENCVRRLVVMYPDTLITKDALVGQGVAVAEVSPKEVSPNASLADWEESALRSALASSRGNVTQAARSLGMSKSTLYRKMKEIGITPDSDRG